ncbi:hypothetical protein AAFF_G00397850 [Aldrovandia affinis]|uniref:Uncharacterized protein n=1 Tax=Aldrovandia affinis TaxID=143900 RepID=A0AAD7SDP8_9TELE|nr:hypothetical protein AAFF_G00397850 [Aldrovandia affinis]
MQEQPAVTPESRAGLLSQTDSSSVGCVPPSLRLCFYYEGIRSQVPQTLTLDQRRRLVPGESRYTLTVKANSEHPVETGTEPRVLCCNYGDMSAVQSPR